MQFQPQAIQATICPVTLPDSHFDRVYDLMQATFTPPELVTKAEYAALVQQSSMPDEHVFSMLALVGCEAMSEVLLGAVMGSYLVIDSEQHLSAALIEYLVVNPAYRQQHGYGRQLLTAFETHMQSIADERDESLQLVMGEVEPELLPFKFKCGYGVAADVWYAQPPIAYDALTGKQLHNEIPKLLAIKPLNGVPCVAAEVLIKTVRAVYLRRYLPHDGTPYALEKASEDIFGRVFQGVVASIGDRAMIPLTQSCVELAECSRF